MILVLSIIWLIIIFAVTENSFGFRHRSSHFLFAYLIYSFPIIAVWIIKWIKGDFFENYFIVKSDIYKEKSQIISIEDLINQIKLREQIRTNESQDMLRKKTLLLTGVSILWLFIVLYSLLEISHRFTLVSFLIIIFPLWCYWYYLFILKYYYEEIIKGLFYCFKWQLLLLATFILPNIVGAFGRDKYIEVFSEWIISFSPGVIIILIIVFFIYSHAEDWKCSIKEFYSVAYQIIIFSQLFYYVFIFINKHEKLRIFRGEYFFNNFLSHLGIILLLSIPLIYVRWRNFKGKTL
ncbi:MAG: hypothetical protein JEY94_14130 [Melioribacteraceae bacterium]|nr:hypothetical protein [Melioribacteraceae bacterium]